MALKSGLAAQFGMVDEVTPGTPVTVTRFLPLVSETMSGDIDRLESEGIIAGRRVLDSDMWAGGNETIEGDLNFELGNRNMGQCFKHMFGTSGTTGSGTYTHTFTPGDLSGVSFTTQIGRPDLAGTVQPFTYAGCKVSSWELAVSQGEIVTLGLSVAAMNEILVRTVTDGVTTDTDATVTSATASFTQDDVGKPITGTGIPAATTIASVTSATSAELSAVATASGTGVTFTIGIALASASYTAGLTPVTFKHGAVTIGGSSVPVMSATISGDNGLKTDRRFLGSGRIKEPLEAAYREYTGTLECEFNDLTQYRRFRAGSTFAMVLTLTSGADTCTVTTNIRYDGPQTPQVGGPDILTQSLPFKCVGDTDAGAITAVLVNSDSSL